MSNLNNNTTQLEALLAKVKALPPADDGESGYDEGYETGKAEVYAEIESANAELEQILNGEDTGIRATSITSFGICFRRTEQERPMHMLLQIGVLNMSALNIRLYPHTKTAVTK